MQLSQITIAIDGTPIIADLSLTITPGSVHALMGPNGSGKSSLAYGLAGHPHYQITTGNFAFNGHDMTIMLPDERARAGFFLACQHPIALPGVSILTFLTEAYRAVSKTMINVDEMHARIIRALEQLGLPASFIDRSVNDGFSGGEKKRFEMVQALILKPQFLILDEIDSGLDIDALSIVGAALKTLRQENPALSILIITHYPRLLQFIVPDEVHIMVKGKLVYSGTKELTHQIEAQGYDAFIAGTIL